MDYRRSSQQLLGAAYVAGPLVMVGSVAAFLFGGRNPEPADWGSGVEGLLGIVGFSVLVPVFVHLAHLLGSHAPRLAVAALITAVLGFAGGGVYQMTMRVMIAGFVDHGLDTSVLQSITDDAEAGSTATLLAVGFGPLVPITSVLVGIGYVRTKLDHRLGWLLAIAGTLLFAGQALVIATEVTYGTAVVLWAVALVPIGARMITAQAAAMPTGGGAQRTTNA
jgi:hypothetical protein